MNSLRLSAGMLILLFISGTAFSQSVQQADSLNRQGMEYYESGNYSKAEHDLHDAFRMYRKVAGSETWLRPGVDYAEILVDRFKYDQALILFNTLNKIAESQNDIKTQARIENDLGWLSRKTGNYDRSLLHLKNAIPLAKQAKDTLRLGYIYNNIGAVYRSRGDYKTAIAYRKKSLVYKEQTGDLKSIAITLNNLGHSYKQLALYDNALDYYKQSLAIKKNLGNTELLASTYNNIASLYKDAGQYDQALIYYQQSLEFYERTGDPKNSAHVLNNIGTLYSSLGQPEEELAYYRLSLQLKEQYANAASVAVTYSNIAESLRINGQNEEALKYYEKALALRRQTGNQRSVASSFLDLSSINHNLGFTEESFKFADKAKTIADATADTDLQQKTYFRLGSLYRSEGKLRKAISLYKRSLIFSQSLKGEADLTSLRALAYTYHQLNSDSAIYYGRRTIDRIEQMRSQTGPLSQFKAGYFKQHAGFYTTMASWVLKYKRDAAEAFKLAESAKSRVLIEELAAAAQRIDESLPEDIRLERAQRRADITDLYVRLDKAEDADTEHKLQARIRDKELAYASFEHQLHQNYKQFKQLPQPEPVTARQVQQMCDSETAVLEYSISDDTIIIFLITKNQITAKQFNISASDYSTGNQLQDRISQFRKAITEHVPKDSLARLSGPLYDQLISPVHNGLKDFENLIIVPDSYLAYLPFEALTDSTNYLVSSYNIKYAPSMTGFSLISSPKTKKPAKLLAIGNTADYSSSGNLPMLPSVGLEIEGIAALFSNTTKLHDAKITEEIIKERIQKDYSYTHIAAHSIIDEQNSSMSGIILGTNGNTQTIGNDGYLRNDEIYRLNIPSQMIVLSACKSGMGRVISGEGMLGLQRAFFNAGASTVVVSLWDVYDRSTTHLMKTFYNSLMEKNENPSWWSYWQSFTRWTGWDTSVPFGNASLSMRETKLAMLEHPRYHHPVYWAPFIVVGR